jgi:hypothetical protein
MMSIGLHLRIIGRPGRIGALDQILAAMGPRDGGMDRAPRGHHTPLKRSAQVR